MSLICKAKFGETHECRLDMGHKGIHHYTRKDIATPPMAKGMPSTEPFVVTEAVHHFYVNGPMGQVYSSAYAIDAKDHCRLANKYYKLGQISMGAK